MTILRGRLSYLVHYHFSACLLRPVAYSVCGCMLFMCVCPMYLSVGCLVTTRHPTDRYNSCWISLFSHSTRNEQYNYLTYHSELCPQRKLIQSSTCTHTKPHTHFKIMMSCPVGSTVSCSVNLPPFVNKNKAC
jgi:hypothetical protein